MRFARAILPAMLSMLACIAVLPGAAHAAAPAPCNDIPQVTDVVGDGHHTGTDLTGAWLSEASGSLQAVIRVRYGVWRPEHEDEPITGSEYALLYTVSGTTRYVRVTAPLTGDLVYDYGTWVAPDVFTSQGTTTGSVTPGVEQSAVIDVPTTALGIAAGTRLSNPFAMTIDGRSALGVPHWVDHAPGAVEPSETAVGADYVVGSCGGAGTGTGGDGSQSTTAVTLSAPTRLVGGGTARLRGSVFPRRADVAVRITIDAIAAGTPTRTLRLRTSSDGSFTAAPRVLEASRVRAVAEDIGSQTSTIDVQATVVVTTQRTAGGATIVRARITPALAGNLMILGTDSIEPSYRRVVQGAGVSRTVRFVSRAAAPGLYQLVYVPFAGRAERVTSRSFRLGGR